MFALLLPLMLATSGSGGTPAPANNALLWNGNGLVWNGNPLIWTP